MNIMESILMAFDAVRVNKLRSSLTLLSIAIGVFAIIGAGSLVESINATVDDQMAALGENSFFISKAPGIQMGDAAWRKYRKRKAITYNQYTELKKKLTLTRLVSAHAATGGMTVKNGDLETNPDVSIMGVDDAFFEINNRNVVQGRAITASDISMNRSVAVVGNDVIVKVFPGRNPIGQKIKVKNQNFEIIGVLDTKGAIMGQSQDNMVWVPITEFLKYYSNEWSESLTIACRSDDRNGLVPAIDEATGVLRSIRNCKPGEENNFEIETNESLKETFGKLTGFLSYFGFFCGAIALIAAGVGIMNIMLVSVKERTREIGIRKAIGAKRSWILTQFLVEAVTLCQIGGIVGILLGIGVGGGLGALVGFKVGIPVLWIVLSITICTLLGVFFGAYPAWKAAKLDPIDALRYE